MCEWPCRKSNPLYCSHRASTGKKENSHSRSLSPGQNPARQTVGLHWHGDSTWNGLFTLADPDLDSDSDSDTFPDHYIVLCRTFHIGSDVKFLHSTGIQVQVRVWIRQMWISHKQAFRIRSHLAIAFALAFYFSISRGVNEPLLSVFAGVSRHYSWLTHRRWSSRHLSRWRSA